ncbi:MAG TPA: ABC transporter permease [Actinomycetota bacterium]|nr:ABC transporter permease [Actinomycetota bacterium]
MATVAAPAAGPALRPPGSFISRLKSVTVMTRRNLVHIAREPLQLSDVTIQPVLFTVLFIYIFGGAIHLPGGSYKDYVVAGLLVFNIASASMGTAVGLSADIATGVIDRFRTLPMWRSAVLAGRSVTDLLTSMLCALIVGVTGLAVGWRSGAPAVSIAAAFGLALAFGFALSWAFACLGLVSKGPESAQSTALLFVFPLLFVSNALVPTQGMPSWMADFANWNPFSAMASAVRDLLHNPNPAATIRAWPMEHPVAASVGWTVALLVVFAPLAAHLFRKRTTG